MEQKEQRQIEQTLYRIGLCLPCIGAALFSVRRWLPGAVLNMVFLPCMFHKATGLYCPGCGGTRAVLALLEGQILQSFFYHPIVVCSAALYLWFMLSHTVEHLSGRRLKIGLPYRNAYLYAALAVIVINTAVKNIALTAFRVDLLKF